MSDLIVTELVSLDGVMEAPGGEPTHPHTGWTIPYHGPEQIEYKFQEVLDAEVHLLGRVTYESFAGAWPTYEGPFADRMNSMPKVVVSATLTDPAWNNTTVLAGPVVDGVQALKERSSGPVLVAGSATLVHTLLDAGLVDELRLMVFPVSIGGGVRVFPDSRRRIDWTVVDSRSFATGVRLDALRPA